MACDQFVGSYCEIDLSGRAFCKCEDKCEKVTFMLFYWFYDQNFKQINNS